jgi:MYXO-CTERM domain-containing protein
MIRSLKATLGIAAAATFLAVAPDAHAAVTQVNSDCEIDTGEDCSSQCSGASFSCDVSTATTCNDSCTKTVEDSCTKTCEPSCETECTKTPGTFSCTGYCGTSCEAGCSTQCSGSDAGTSCTTECQAACTSGCTEQCKTTAPTVSCTTQCQTSCTASCTAQVNLSCNIDCQSSKSETCSATAGSCNTTCSGSGAVVVCHGKVVNVAASVADAEAYVVANVEADFKLNVTTAASCTGDTCKSSVSCSTTPGVGAGSYAFLTTALAFGFVGIARRRNDRKRG